MLPSASELTYFIEVATSLNVSRASERLGISQPSLTLAIQRLENAVGTPLLIRSKKGVTLTQAGKQLLPHARELLQKWESVKGQALASTSETQGNYIIGCHASVALYSVDRFLPQLLENNPKLEIKLYHDLSRRITEAVIRMEIDLGIVVNPIRHPDLVIRKLYDDEVTVWVGEGTRKVQNFRSGEAVLICDPELIQSQTLLKKLKKSTIQFSRILPTSNLEVVTKLVAAGGGIGILPGKVATSATHKPLRKIPKAPVLRDEICVLYRVENKSIRSIQVMNESISKIFSDFLMT